MEKDTNDFIKFNPIIYKCTKHKNYVHLTSKAKNCNCKQIYKIILREIWIKKYEKEIEKLNNVISYHKEEIVLIKQNLDAGIKELENGY